MQKFFYLAVGVAFIAGSVYFFLQQPAPEKYRNPPPAKGELEGVLVNGRTISVELADSVAERQKGLSDRNSLPAGQGMLFVFDETGKHGIWMKDMRFSIDVIWLDEANKVVWVERDLSPETFPKVFYPESPAKYVLELLAGTSDELNIQAGDIIK